jgi:hypothetical protein
MKYNLTLLAVLKGMQCSRGNTVALILQSSSTATSFTTVSISVGQLATFLDKTKYISE